MTYRLLLGQLVINKLVHVTRQITYFRLPYVLYPVRLLIRICYSSALNKMNAVLITGCNRGLGLGLVQSFLRLQNHPIKYIFATVRDPDRAQVSGARHCPCFGGTYEQLEPSSQDS